MNVFVYGYYGFGNAGDELLLRRVIEYFKPHAPNIKFVVRSHDQSQPGFEGEPVEFVNLDASLSQPNSSKLKGFIDYIKLGAKLIKNNQAFVFGGGTLFQSSGRIPYTLILMTSLCVLAKIYRVPVYALGVGVGPLKDRLSQMLFRLILSLSTDFAVRDVTSMRNACFASRSTKLRLTSDLVFGASGYKLSDKAQKPAVGSLNRIGITLAASDSKLTKSNREALSTQLNVLIQDVREQSPNCKISCLTFQDFETDSGVKLSDQNMLQQLVDPEVLKYVDFCPMPNKIDVAMQLVSSCDVILGMRFHGLVLAAMARVPFVGVSRDHKVLDLCEKFSFPSWDISQGSEVSLFECVKKASENEVCQNTLNSCKRLSDANFDEIGKVLSSRK